MRMEDIQWSFPHIEREMGVSHSKSIRGIHAKPFSPYHSSTFKNVCICYRFSVYLSYMHAFIICVTTIISSNIVFLHLFATFCVHVCINVSLYLYTHQYTYIDSVIVCALTAIDHGRDQVISAALTGSKRRPF